MGLQIKAYALRCSFCERIRYAQRGYCAGEHQEGTAFGGDGGVRSKKIGMRNPVLGPNACDLSFIIDYRLKGKILVGNRSRSIVDCVELVCRRCCV